MSVTDEAGHKSEELKTIAAHHCPEHKKTEISHPSSERALRQRAHYKPHARQQQQKMLHGRE